MITYIYPLFRHRLLLSAIYLKFILQYFRLKMPIRQNIHQQYGYWEEY
jgi:hypothetical protein